MDLVDDRLEPIPYDRCYDLVGITCTCATSPPGPATCFFHWAANRHLDPVDFY